jgi:cell division inhibitor SepF
MGLNRSNVIGMPGINNNNAEVVVIQLHSFEEMPQVIQTLRERKSVVLNLNVMDPEEAQRAVDFVAGGTYAIDGHQERIGESIFLFTPSRP